MSPASSTPDVLDLLVEQYRDAPAPAPSAELLARMEEGRVDAVVVPFTPRRRARVRYLVAATVATVLAMSGLAVAGELPDSWQRRVASITSEFGIDLPDPQPTPAPSPTGGRNGSTVPSTSAPGAPAGTGTGTGTGTAPSTVPTPTLPPAVQVPGVPDVPPATTPQLTVPPLTTPPILGLPPVSLPIGVPTIPLPPVPLPHLDLPGL